MYQVCIQRHGNASEVCHTFMGLDEARAYYARKVSQGINAGYHFDADMYAGHFEPALNCFIVDACVATFTWDWTGEYDA